METQYLYAIEGKFLPRKLISPKDLVALAQHRREITKVVHCSSPDAGKARATKRLYTIARAVQLAR